MTSGFAIGVVLGLVTLAIIWEVSKPKLANEVGAYINAHWQEQLTPEDASIVQAFGGQSIVNLVSNGVVDAIKTKLP